MELLISKVKIGYLVVDYENKYNSDKYAFSTKEQLLDFLLTHLGAIENQFTPGIHISNINKNLE